MSCADIFLRDFARVVGQGKFHYAVKKIRPPQKSPLYRIRFPASLHYTASLKNYTAPALFSPLVPGVQNIKICQFTIDYLLID